MHDLIIQLSYAWIDNLFSSLQHLNFLYLYPYFSLKGIVFKNIKSSLIREEHN